MDAGYAAPHGADRAVAQGSPESLLRCRTHTGGNHTLAVQHPGLVAECLAEAPEVHQGARENLRDM